MEVRKLEMETQIVQFPRELDMTLVSFSQEKAELVARENLARNYSDECKRQKQRKRWKADDTAELIAGIVSGIMIIGIYASYLF